MDFDLNLYEDLKPPKPASPKMECFIPVADSPQLNKSERHAILYKEDVIDTIHLVKPGFLHGDENGGVTFSAPPDLGYYLVCAKLKKSPYIVLFDEYLESNRWASKPEMFREEDVFYIDGYFAPGFGLVRPKYFLFERINLNAIPNSVVLFRTTGSPS